MASLDPQPPGPVAGCSDDRKGAPAATLVDAHVHLHPGCDEIELLDAARANFLAARRRLALASGSPELLLLTESCGQSVFDQLYERAPSDDGTAWTFRRTLESESLIACRGGVEELILVAGRQIATREGLEVLALGCRREWGDGRAIEEILAQVGDQEALAVVPWGFGKWWFRRGRLLAELLEKVDCRWFFLGDNGGRPRLAAQPGLFARAAERGIRVLPGTDPLPLPRQAQRVGSYGFALRSETDLRTPAAGLKQILRDPAVRPMAYGEGARLLPFLRDQLAMQLLKLAGGSGK